MSPSSPPGIDPDHPQVSRGGHQSVEARGTDTVAAQTPANMMSVEMASVIEFAVARQNDVLIITDADGGTDRIVYANPAIFRHSGYSPEEVIGNTPRMFQGPDTSRATLDRIRSAVDARQPIREELLNYCKNGAQYWTEIDITPVIGGDGIATHMVSVQRDITQQKSIREEMQRKDQRFVRAIEASANAIWEWTIATGDVEYRDEMPGLSWHGQHYGTLKGKGLRVMLDLVHPEDRDRIRQSLLVKIAGEDLLYIEEYRFRRPDDTYAHVSDRQFVLRHPDGKAETVIGSLLDISDKRENENRRHQSQRLELLGEMTGGIAHNFNNLLTVILGSIDRLREGNLDVEAVLDTIGMIDDAAQRGATLTEHLMSFSQVKAMTLRSVDVAQLIAQSSPVWRNLLSPEIRLEVLGNPDLWPASTDKVHLEAVMLNLVINARDAMPQGGDLKVEMANIEADSELLRADESKGLARYVMISFTDTGIGMPPEHVKLAFDPFFTTKPAGTGLGLSSAYGFLKQSGGFIRLQSSPGTGTTVRIFLLVAEDEPEPELGANSRTIPKDGGHSILVVDDDPLVREYVQALLTSLSYRVNTAANGEDALRLLATGIDVDLLFTDILMDDGMNGWELANCAQALFPEMPVLFTSAYPEADNMPSKDLIGTIHMLRKPYRSRELAMAILASLPAAEAPEIAG